METQLENVTIPHRGLIYLSDHESSGPENAVDISAFRSAEALAESKANERIGAALAFCRDILNSPQQWKK